MKVLITAGPTREPIDPVRYIGNRSSGKMGAALAAAALKAGHLVTLILGPGTVPMPGGARQIAVETAAQMHDAVLREFPAHDLLIMAAAVADFRPRQIQPDKVSRTGPLTIECEPTEDVIANAGRIKRPDQRTIGFSLESASNLIRARQKLKRKRLDLMVYNPIATMESPSVGAILLWPDGRSKELSMLSKPDFARKLIERVPELFKTSRKVARRR
ncbi:MAG TPA: phosphopantothenoylcysteine decarboxylase [Tepidisphaeraceae bacterium]|nr:phosphopantothenoylcysteine decarboxylase [Tepidisphaeraceae bacterium]